MITDENIKEYVATYLENPNDLPKKLRDISTWDVSNVTDMSGLFADATDFNQPLNDWDVSNVTDMSYMFYRAESFNQPLNDWDVVSVTDMSNMFEGATSFNQTLNDWDVVSVTDMSRMFEGATSFNQPLNDWNIVSVTDMSMMFEGATSFNQPLNDWDISNVTDMSNMFNGASSFNQDLTSWDVSNVEEEQTDTNEQDEPDDIVTYTKVEPSELNISTDTPPKPDVVTFDIISQENENVIDYLNFDKDNIAFKYNNSYFLSNKNDIINSVINNNNIKYSCLRPGSLGSVVKDTPYLSLNGIGIIGAGVSLLSQIKKIMTNDRIKIIKVILTDKLLPSTASLQVLLPGANWVSAAHCQEGQESYVSDLEEIPYPVQQGGKYKKSMKNLRKKSMKKRGKKQGKKSMKKQGKKSMKNRRKKSKKNI